MDALNTRSSATIDDMRSRIGTDFGHSDWITIDQPMISAFATLTMDEYFIHTDPARAARETPHGGTIAHGFLTLSLMPSFFDSAMQVKETRMGINYGVNKVRFTAPVPVGSRLRARISLQSADPIEPKGFQMVYAVTVEREGSDKPVCVAETIARRYA